MPEFERHSLFFDCRDAKVWRDKIRDELLPQLLQFLEEWSDAKPRIVGWDVEDRLAAETAGKAEPVQQQGSGCTHPMVVMVFVIHDLEKKNSRGRQACAIRTDHGLPSEHVL